MADIFSQYEVEEVPPKKKATPEEDPFAAYEVSAESSAEPTPAQPTEVPEQDPFAAYSATPAAPSTVPEATPERQRGTAIPRERIKQIAEKFGVDEAELETVVPYYNMRVEGDDSNTNDFKQVAGFLSESVGMSAPTWIYKKLQDDPAKREALDAIREEAEARKSWAMQGAELAAGLGSAVGIGRGAAAVAGKVLGEGTQAAQKALTAYDLASATGGSATTGLTTSEEGDEVKDTFINGAIGLTLGAAVVGASKLLKGGKKASEKVLEEGVEKSAKGTAGTEKDIIETFTGEEGLNIMNKTEEVLKQNIDDELVRRNAVLSDAAGEVVVPPTEVPKKLSGNSGRIIAEEMAAAGGNPREVESVQKFLSRAEIVDDQKRFASWLEGGILNKGSTYSDETALKTIKDTKLREGEEYLNKRWAEFRKAEVAQGIIQKNLDKIPANVIAKNAFARLATVVFDARQFAGRYIDRRLGTRITPMLDRLSTSNNKFTYTIANFGKKGDEVAKLIPKDSKKAIYDALNTGNVMHLKPEEKAIVESYQKLFEEGRLRAIDEGINIAKKDHYIKHSMVDLPDAIVKIRGKVKDIFESTGRNVARNLDQVDYEDLLKGNTEFKELAEGIAYFNQAKIPQDVLEFKEMLRNSVNPSRGRNMWATQAGAAFERTTEEVPAFLRETDVTKLYQSWMHNTFRHAYYRDAIAEAKLFRQVAMDAGDDTSTKWISNWIADMSGGSREGTIKRTMRDMSIEARVHLLEMMKNPNIPAYQKFGAKLLYETPNIMPALINQIYPNLLGMNVKAVLTNLMQPIAVTWPELGGVYGGVRIASAYKDILKTVLHGKEMKIINPDVAAMLGKQVGDTVKTRNLTTILMNEGQIANQWNTELVGALKDGIASNPLYNMGAKVLDGATKFSMFAYEKSESLNRMVVREMAPKIADDLRRGLLGKKDVLSSRALKFMDSLDITYRNEIRRAIESGGEGKVEKVITEYLIGKSIFNYNRATLSEFGRAVGPLVTTFTKWPLSVAGDIAFELMSGKTKTEKAMILSRRYLAPLAVFSLVDSLAEFESDREKALVGSGTKRYAALGSVASVLSGDIAKPPVISAISDLATGVMDGDPDKLWEWLNNTMQTFVPGMGYVRFTLQDYPAIMEDDKPDGKILDIMKDKLQ